MRTRNFSSPKYGKNSETNVSILRRKFSILLVPWKMYFCSSDAADIIARSVAAEWKKKLRVKLIVFPFVICKYACGTFIHICYIGWRFIAAGFAAFPCFPFRGIYARIRACQRHEIKFMSKIIVTSQRRDVAQASCHRVHWCFRISMDVLRIHVYARDRN